MPFASSSVRRSPRLVRAAWLKRLRPRASTVMPVTLIDDELYRSTQLRHQRIRAAAGMSLRLRPRPVKAPQRLVQSNCARTRTTSTYVKSRLRPRKAGKVVYRPKPQVTLSKPVPRKAREVFIMTKNPLFSVAATAVATDESFMFEPPVTAPRACTGWNCVCAAPHGYGEGRANYCRFYDTGPPPTIESMNTMAALPMLRTALLPLMLASIGIPVIPSSPCLSQ